ncbi:MAG: hypothetical protein ACI4VQ_04000 [Clostridia bacterium]
MIIINISEIDYSTIIIETINQLFSRLFASLDNSLYSLLDKSIFINEDILSDSFFNSIFNSSFGLPAIANALLIGFVIYYCFKLSMSHFSGINIERPYQFLVKIIIVAICINFSSFICEKILGINSLITEAICELGQEVSGQKISFNNLIEKSTYINTLDNFNLFSLEGILESFFSFGLVSLLFSYSIRYILVKIFVMLSPFALLSLATTSSSWLFKSWIRTFLSLLIVQSFIAIILTLLFSLNIEVSNVFSQISYVSTIFILSKANSYIKELIGGISFDINMNISNLKSLLR